MFFFFPFFLHTYLKWFLPCCDCCQNPSSKHSQGKGRYSATLQTIILLCNKYCLSSIHPVIIIVQFIYSMKSRKWGWPAILSVESEVTSTFCIQRYVTDRWRDTRCVERQDLAILDVLWVQVFRYLTLVGTVGSYHASDRQRPHRVISAIPMKSDFLAYV